MLTPGSTIAVVAPAGVPSRVRLAASIGIVESWGYRVRRMPSLGNVHRYTAGTAAQRTADLREALTAPDIDAVWFARGGFGTVHLLGALPYAELDNRPVIGFSDATALFAAMHGRGGNPVHGPVLHSLADHVDADSLGAMRRFLQNGASVDLPGTHLAGPAHAVSGPVVGGNLCVLASLLGTPWALDASGAVLVLEDIHEPAYKLDRLVTQMLMAGAFAGVRGIAIGELTGCRGGDDWTALDLLVELLAPLGVPVVGGLPVGHGARNHPWRHGGAGHLTASGLRID